MLARVSMAMRSRGNALSGSVPAGAAPSVSGSSAQSANSRRAAGWAASRAEATGGHGSVLRVIDERRHVETRDQHRARLARAECASRLRAVAARRQPVSTVVTRNRFLAAPRRARTCRRPASNRTSLRPRARASRWPRRCAPMCPARGWRRRSRSAGGRSRRRPCRPGARHRRLVAGHRGTAQRRVPTSRSRHRSRPAGARAGNLPARVHRRSRPVIRERGCRCWCRRGRTLRRAGRSTPPPSQRAAKVQATAGSSAVRGAWTSSDLANWPWR